MLIEYKEKSIYFLCGALECNEMTHFISLYLHKHLILDISCNYNCKLAPAWEECPLSLIEPCGKSFGCTKHRVPSKQQDFGRGCGWWIPKIFNVNIINRESSKLKNSRGRTQLILIYLLLCQQQRLKLLPKYWYHHIYFNIK